MPQVLCKIVKEAFINNVRAATLQLRISLTTVLYNNNHRYCGKRFYVK